jgi:hypothetical protein
MKHEATKVETVAQIPQTAQSNFIKEVVANSSYFGEIESAIPSVQDAEEVEPVQGTSAQSSSSDSSLITTVDAINSFQEPPVLTQRAFSGDEMMPCPNGCGNNLKLKVIFDGYFCPFFFNFCWYESIIHLCTLVYLFFPWYKSPIYVVYVDGMNR